MLAAEINSPPQQIAVLGQPLQQVQIYAYFYVLCINPHYEAEQMLTQCSLYITMTFVIEIYEVAVSTGEMIHLSRPTNVNRTKASAQFFSYMSSESNCAFYVG